MKRFSLFGVPLVLGCAALVAGTSTVAGQVATRDVSARLRAAYKAQITLDDRRTTPGLLAVGGAKNRCDKVGTIEKEGKYYILNNCVMRFAFPTSVTINEGAYQVTRIVVVLSPDDQVNLDRDAVLLDRPPQPGETQVRYIGSSRIAGDGEYIIAQVYIGGIGTTLQYRFQVRPAGFYWQRLSLGAALSYNKPETSAEYELTPSPVLYSALGWSYWPIALNYLFPRSVGVMINPDAVSGADGSDLKPQLVLGVGTSWLDDNVVLGIAWEGGNNWRPRYVVSWKAVVFGQP